jgi:hypothetical protein
MRLPCPVPVCIHYMLSLQQHVLNPYSSGDKGDCVVPELVLLLNTRYPSHTFVLTLTEQHMDGVQSNPNPPKRRGDMNN